MKIREDGILVEEVDRDVQVSGLHIVRKDESKKALWAKVLGVGPDVREDIREGDIVVTDYALAGSAWKDKIFLRESDVIAVERP